MPMEKNLVHNLRYDLVQLRENSCSSTSLKKSQVSSSNFRDKVQFVNSVKRLVFNLTKIPFLKCLIIYNLIAQRSESFYRIDLTFYELCPVLFNF